MPANLEAEKAVLGTIFLRNAAAMDVLPVLRRDDFFFPSHRRIYGCIEEMVAQGKPVDLTLVSDALESSKELEEAGGAAYISSLMDGMPSATNAAHYAGIVREKARLRQLIHACEEISSRAMESASASQVVESAVEKLLALAGDERGAAKIREWNEAAASAVRELENTRDNPKDVFRLRSGINALDEILSGLRKKELTLIVGGTSHGKSLLSEQFAIDGDSSGYQGMIFSAEMSAESIAIRQLAYEADVFFYHTRKPENMDEMQFEALRLASKRERRLGIVDAGITPARVWALAEARKRSSGLDFVIVDYDQLVIGAGEGASADPDIFFARQGEFVMRAAEIAKRLDIAFILLAQPRKIQPGVKRGEKPSLDDIYGHSAMRNTPHVIMWVVRDFFVHGLDPKYERSAKVYVLKSRNDKTGTAKVAFDPNRVRLMDKKAEDAGEES